jgi:hypothetical protein
MAEQMRRARQSANRERLARDARPSHAGPIEWPRFGADAAATDLRLLAGWDAGSRQRNIAALQRSIGNRRVSEALSAMVPAHAASPRPASLAAIASTATTHPGAQILHIGIPIDFEALGVTLTAAHSTAAAPPAGAQQIRNEGGNRGRAAGYTSLPAPTPPEFLTSEPQQRGGRWVAAVRPTTVGADPPQSLYPAAGVHDVGTGPTGQQRHVDVTADMAEVIRQGEDEHLLDLEWARHLSYDRAAASVNAAAASESPAGDSPAAARRLAADQVRADLPPQLRWADGEDPFRTWTRAYSRLAHVTIERDESGWHAMTSAFVLEAAEKQRLGVPVADELTRYVGGPQIGQHPSAPLVRARFDELPRP